MNLHCLSFFQALATALNPLPPDVEKTVKSRLSYQYHIQYPNQEIHFDDPQCELKGVYTLTSSSLILNGDNDVWKGSLEIPFNNLLDGKKISFFAVSPTR